MFMLDCIRFNAVKRCHMSASLDNAPTYIPTLNMTKVEGLNEILPFLSFLLPDRAGRGREQQSSRRACVRR